MANSIFLAGALGLLIWVALVLPVRCSEAVSYYDVRPEGNPHLYDPAKAAELHTFYVKKMKEKREHPEGHHHRNVPKDTVKADTWKAEKSAHDHALAKLRGGQGVQQREEAKADPIPDRMMDSIQKLLANVKAEDMTKALDEGMRD